MFFTLMPMNVTIFFLVSGATQMFWVIPVLKGWRNVWYYVGIGGTMILIALFVIAVPGRGLPISVLEVTIELIQIIFIICSIIISLHVLSNITVTELGDVNVLDIKSRDWKDNGKVLVYLHGGGYTLLSANSALGTAATVANSTGLRVISVDYSLAPSSKWNQTINEVISVIQALKEEGYSLNDIAMIGDSAGGGLVAGSVLKMRDEGLGIPARSMY